jgi:hypothetical protein
MHQFSSEHLLDASLWGRLPAFNANIRQDSKVLPWTNILSYFEHLQITDEKSFIALTPGPNVIKHLWSLIYGFSY